MRRTMIIVAGAVTAALIAGCGSGATPLVTHHTSPPPAQFTPSPASSSPYTAQIPATSSALTPYQQWWQDTGQGAWDTVVTDLEQVKADYDAGDMISMETDGGTLSQDALTAVQDGPPTGTDPGTDWFGAFSALALAGTDIEYGYYVKSEPLIVSATTYIENFKTEASSQGVTVS